MTQLTFEQEYRYKDDDEGIPVEVTLSYAGHSMGVWAKVDPGAAVCLFGTTGISVGAELNTKGQRIKGSKNPE
ncbi:MAG: hypothetical protein ACRD82_24190, partial [Blastocatellia bacterium]